MRHCPTCDRNTDGGIWCGRCSKAYDPDEAREILTSLTVHSFTGKASLSPAMESFYETGDPTVFDKAGA